MKALKKIIGGALLIALLMTFVSCTEEKTNEENNGTPAMYVVYNGTKITMGADADGIIKALGEADDRREIGDCGGFGAQVRYTYQSMELYVLESKTDGNIVDQITFRDDLIETPEGVCIGMSKDAVLKALGEPSSQNDTRLEYISGKYILTVGMKDGVVNEINYMTD